MSDALSHIQLSAADLARLPGPIRRKIEAAFDPTDSANGKWILVGASSARLATTMSFVVDRLAPLASGQHGLLREKNIEKLLELIVEDLPRAQIESDLEYDNAVLRAEYLAEVPVLSAAQVRENSGLKPSNKSEPASRWKREGRLFAVRKGGIDLYPAFQFVDGSPNPVVRKVLEVLPKDMSPWQTALWFASGNGWLDGAEPQDCLGQPDDLIHAARQLTEPAVG